MTIKKILTDKQAAYNYASYSGTELVNRDLEDAFLEGCKHKAKQINKIKKHGNNTSKKKKS